MKKLSPAVVWSVVALVCGICCVVAVVLALAAESDFCFYGPVLMASVFFHVVVMVLSAPLVQAVFKKNFNYRSFWFRQKGFEQTLYRVIKVKIWKSKIVSYDKSEYLFSKHTPLEVIMNMCHAEIVHEVIAVASYLSVLLGLLVDHYLIFLVSSFCFSLCHLVFVFVQRYNRPRVVRIHEKTIRNEKKVSQSIAPEPHQMG